MDIPKRKPGYLWGLLALTGLLALSACGGGTTSTPNVEGAYTAAYETIAVLETTQLAAAPATPTPLPTQLPSLPAATQAVNTVVVATPTTQGCDGSLYLTDVTIPDGTLLTEGQAFTKTWSVKNTGTCTWNPNYKLMFVFGSAMHGNSSAVPQSVPPGQSVQLSVSLVAPSSLGNYTGNWKLQNDRGGYFGTYLTVVINVVASTATPTVPTPTSTPAAATPTNTPGPAPSATSTP